MIKINLLLRLDVVHCAGVLWVNELARWFQIARRDVAS